MHLMLGQMASQQEGSGTTDAGTSCDASLEASMSISKEAAHTHLEDRSLITPIHLAMSNHKQAFQPDGRHQRSSLEAFGLTI